MKIRTLKELSDYLKKLLWVQIICLLLLFFAMLSTGFKDMNFDIVDLFLLLLGGLFYGVFNTYFLRKDIVIENAKL